MRLSEKQWEHIRDIIPDGFVRTDGRGRPWADKRGVLEGVLWIAKTGARWKDLPAQYPPYQTCHRRFQQWVETGVFERIVEALARDLVQRGDIDLSECFIDGTFVLAKKGAFLWATLAGVKAPASWQSRTLVVLFYLSQSTLLDPMKSTS